MTKSVQKMPKSNQIKFARVFKRESGETIGKSIRQRPMDETCRLIENTVLSIGQFAKRVDVGDESTLRRWFVAQFETSPQQFFLFSLDDGRMPGASCLTIIMNFRSRRFARLAFEGFSPG